MVNPVNYHIESASGGRQITIEPVYEEIAFRDLFATGRYILSEGNHGIGEIRVDGELFECELNSNVTLEDENVYRIVNFIKEYNEPELAGYVD